MRQLETANPKFLRREDLIWYLVTVGGLTIVGPSSTFFLFVFFSPLVYLPA
jgi:hypothetical protein